MRVCVWRNGDAQPYASPFPAFPTDFRAPAKAHGHATVFPDGRELDFSQNPVNC